MDKQVVVQPYNRILITNNKEKFNDTINDVN